MCSGKPQVSNQARSWSCTRVAATKANIKRGSTPRAPPRPGACVGHPQPADLLAVAQLELVAGVELPGMVGGGGPRLAAGPPARRRGGELRLPQPILQGADTGEI